MYDVRTIPTKNGQTNIAEFETEEGEQFTAWMPDSLIKKFNTLKVEECNVLK